jgi:hypothetical protein
MGVRRGVLGKRTGSRERVGGVGGAGGLMTSVARGRSFAWWPGDPHTACQWLHLGKFGGSQIAKPPAGSRGPPEQQSPFERQYTPGPCK